MSSGGPIETVRPELLRRRCDPTSLGLATTADAEPLSGPVGQKRAVAALAFGTELGQASFHLFVLGPPGSGKSTAVRELLETLAAGRAAPDDWVYVNNFDTTHRPHALTMPKGRARTLRRALIDVVDDLRASVPAMLDSDEYQSRRGAIDNQARQTQEEAFEALNARAKAQGVAIVQTPMGFAMAPLKDGEVIKPEEFKSLPRAERDAIGGKIQALQSELEDVLKQVPRIDKDRRSKIRELNEELAAVAVHTAISDVEAQFADLPDVARFLDRAARDMIAHAALFSTDGEESAEAVGQPTETEKDPRYRRYMVNVIINNAGLEGAPIVEVENPTFGNIVGRVEHLSQMGALVTDFLMIKSGALHAANGGFMLIDARRILMQPFAWEALKRALRGREITIESPAEQLSLVSTVSLQPDRVPLDVKVILFGDRKLYYLLSALDPDFAGIFKVAADFEDAMDLTADNIALFVRLVASIVARRQLRHVDAGGLARLVEESSRLADDSEKLALRIEPIADLLVEADYWARQAGREETAADDVARAVRESTNRLDRLRERVQESILRGIMVVETSGAKIGQVNGLSVLTVGAFTFGRPSRITARARMGSGRLVDIEREVELGGPLHSKGIMILRGFLEGRYARQVPLSLSASLVFEQSYGGVDGDSASSAELYALLSALAEVPLKQCFAVTGSVDQNGLVQAIGGVNQKIEGFFDICDRRGLTGEQGVLIPRANLAHLMVRDDVLEAAKAGAFHIHAVATIDQGIEILTGMPAGERGEDGGFPEGSVNRRVEDRLIAFAMARQLFAGSGRNGEQDDTESGIE